MEKSTPPTESVAVKRAHPLRTGKIHVTKATASEIARSVGVRPSEARIAKKVLLRMGLLAPKTVATKNVVSKKPGRASK